MGLPSAFTQGEFVAVQELNRDHAKTVVMVTHDPKAAVYAHRMLYLDKGTLVEASAAEAVL